MINEQTKGVSMETVDTACIRHCMYMYIYLCLIFHNCLSIYKWIMYKRGLTLPSASSLSG